jgi:putative ABC transport system permease protein
MMHLAWKNLRSHRRRFAGMFLASFIGVAFLAGTLVLGDTLSRNFDSLLGEANAGVDVVIRSTSVVSASGARDDVEQRELLDASLVERVAQVDGVASAVGRVQGYGQLIGRDGDGVGGNGPPRMAGSWVDDPALNPYKLVEGRAPRTDDEVVVNQGAADLGDLHVGDHTVVQTPEPVPVTIVGIATFGDEPGLGGVTFTAFTLEGAQQHLLHRADAVSDILVRGDDGVSQSALASRVRTVLPHGMEALTGNASTHEARDNINSNFLTGLRTILVVFAGIALLVAAFSIYNTFAIVVAQRSRESALLRAVGASRAQVLRSVLVEVVAVAVTSSVAGLLGGLGVAGLLKGMFDSFGFALPAGGLVVTTGAVVAALAVGVIVTVVAGVAPALRASRIAPIRALRDSETETSPFSLGRGIVAGGLLALGIAGIVAGVLGSGTAALARAGLGGAVLLAGVVAAGPFVAHPVARLLGVPLRRFRGVTGALAGQNALRNPRRTASTASALLVGVTIVTLFTVFAASLQQEIDDTVSRTFAGDLVVNAPSFGGGALSPQIATAVAKVPEVDAAVGVGQGAVVVDGHDTAVTVTTPAQLDALLDIDVVHGSLASMGDTSIAVAQSRADDEHWHVGSHVQVAFADRAKVDATIGAIYDEKRIVGSIVVPRAMYAPHATQPTDNMVLVDVRDGVSLAQAKSSIDRVVKPFGSPDVQDRDEYIAAVSSGADMMLGMVYVMLALAIVIALMGIANTLSLAVYERTREVGLLRAVGESRRQVRSMIRWESVIIATFGTIVGLATGVLLAWAVVQAASSAGLNAFRAPVGRLAIVLVIGALAGVLASLRPARRAARLSVIDAIVSP